MPMPMPRSSCIRSFSQALGCSFVRIAAPLQYQSRAHQQRALTFSTTAHAAMAPIQRSALFEAIQSHDPSRTAIVHSLSGRTFKYGGLLQDVAAAKDRLLKSTGRSEDAIKGERIALLVENSYDYVVSLLACLAANAVAVPLAPSFTAGELRYNVNQSESITLLHSAKFEKIAREVLQEGLDKPVVSVAVEKAYDQEQNAKVNVELVGDAGAAEGGMMLYTSGTTARPKGVLLPQKVLIAQAKSLIEAWKYDSKDRLLHVLPLHHIHGTVNALLTPILAGSTIEFMFPFNVDAVWKRFAAPFLSDSKDRELRSSPITFFTVVPTIWARMLQSHPGLSKDLQDAGNEAIKRENLRLNISGSAALPTPTKTAWTDLSSGNVLLERYGMTEVGMALSCGLDDPDRIDGSVGWPLPSVQARLVDSDTNEVIPEGEGTDANGKERSGEIQLKGPTIFQCYWNNEEATRKEFTSDGWFKTGDVAIRKSVQNAGTGKSGDWAKGPAWFIQGRNSADIIKTGGEKVSALEIERELLSLPEVKECAVVGLPSVAWGQKAAAIVVLTDQGKTAGKGGKEWSALDMRRALHDRMVAYKIPQDMKIVDELPRNAMGKINKKELVPKIFGDDDQIRRRSIDVAEDRKQAKAESKEDGASQAKR